MEVLGGLTHLEPQVDIWGTAVYATSIVTQPSRSIFLFCFLFRKIALIVSVSFSDWVGGLHPSFRITCCFLYHHTNLKILGKVIESVGSEVILEHLWNSAFEKKGLVHNKTNHLFYKVIYSPKMSHIEKPWHHCLTVKPSCGFAW